VVDSRLTASIGAAECSKVCSSERLGDSSYQARIAHLKRSSGPPEDQQRDKNHYIDEQPNQSLLHQQLHAAIPEQKYDRCREYSRTRNHVAPPYLLDEDPNAASSKYDGSQ